tara:strand:- start:11159 stop:11395 length:237 start_codon:yes stop_codon:yes gene_type:complete
MKITKEMLKELIKEELGSLEEEENSEEVDDNVRFFDSEEAVQRAGEIEGDEDEEDMSEEEIIENIENMLDMLRKKLNV